MIDAVVIVLRSKTSPHLPLTYSLEYIRTFGSTVNIDIRTVLCRLMQYMDVMQERSRYGVL